MMAEMFRTGRKVVQYVDEDTARRHLGIAVRRQRQGPECELIEHFLHTDPVRLPRGSRLTIFREPYLQSGAPDLVLVAWKEAATRRWAATRADLTRDDIRLVHHLVQRRRASGNELQTLFSRRADSSLERLQAADMVRRKRGEWEPLPLSRIFAVTGIIAIEAKMSEWKAAVQQAFLNTWFASSSYVLVPRVPRRSNLITHAQARGVGVLSLEIPQKVLVSSPMLPRSYASWLFNEWVWKSSGVTAGL